MSLRSEFSTWRPPFLLLIFSWNVSARFLILAWQLRLTLDAWTLDYGGRIALGTVDSLQSAQHCAGGAITRFALVITPHRVHYTFGHVRRCGGHIKWSIARRHRDAHACA